MVKYKVIYTDLGGVEYVENKYSFQKKKRGSNSGKVRLLMWLKREEYNLDFKLLQKKVFVLTGVYINWRHLIEYENCKEEFNIEKKEAIAEVLGLKVKDLEVIEDY